LLAEEKQVWHREMIRRTDGNHPWLERLGQLPTN